MHSRQSMYDTAAEPHLGKANGRPPAALFRRRTGSARPAAAFTLLKAARWAGS